MAHCLLISKMQGEGDCSRGMVGGGATIDVLARSQAHPSYIYDLYMYVYVYVNNLS